MSTIKPLVYDAANARLAEIEIQSPIGKNLLINSDMQINQRGFAGGALAAGAYGYDRWKAGAGGCNVSVNNAGVVTHTSGPLVQIVESPLGVYGANVTFSVQDPSGTVNVSVGGISGSIAAGSGRRSVTLAIPSGSGNLTVQITATGVTYKLPQMERGEAAAGFDARPQGLEVLLCQRYYEKSFALDVAPANAEASGFFIIGTIYIDGILKLTVPFKVPKRAVPAMAFYGSSAGGNTGGNYSYYSGSAWVTSPAVPSAVLVTANGASFDTRVPALAYGTSAMVTGHWTADAEL